MRTTFRTILAVLVLLLAVGAMFPAVGHALVPNQELHALIWGTGGALLAMPIGIYDTAVLVKVVNRLDKQPPAFLLDTFFKTEQYSDDEYIYFDVEKVVPRIAPYVAGEMPGKIVELPGFDTERFKPAYVKPKTRLSPRHAQKRRIGEELTGSMTPEQRAAARLNDAIDYHLTMLKRREEIQASEFLRTGKITVSGEGFNPVTVDFKRDAGLTVTLAGTARWNDAATVADPLADIEARSTYSANNGGAPTQVVVMDPDAWTAFRKRLVARGEAAILFDYARASQSKAEMGPGSGAKVEYKGKIGSYEFYTYQDSYVDDAGVTQQVMPSGTVIGGNVDLLEGTRCYGMIEDEEAGLKAIRYFAKSWLEKDPSVRWLLTQSAPLMVGYRPNTTWCMKVFG